jgi:hypothetical protein
MPSILILRFWRCDKKYRPEKKEEKRQMTTSGIPCLLQSNAQPLSFSLSALCEKKPKSTQKYF